jgi:hypothetical protein
MDPIHTAVIERQKLKELNNRYEITITSIQKSISPRITLQRLSKSLNRLLTPKKQELTFKLISFGKNDKL